MNLRDRVVYIAWRSNGAEVPPTELDFRHLALKAPDRDVLSAIRQLQSLCQKDAGGS